MGETNLLDNIQEEPLTYGEQQCMIEEEKEELMCEPIGPMPDTVQVCPYAKEEPPNKSENPVCNLTALQISIPGKGSISNPTKPLKIVSGYKKKETAISCTVLGLVGPCPSHKDKTFNIAFKKEASKLTSGALDFTARSVPFYKIFDNGTLFPWNARQANYNIGLSTCGNSSSAELIVYPDVEIEIDIPFEFSKSKKQTTQYSRSRQSEWEKSEDSEALEIKAKYVEDGRNHSVSTNIEKKFDVIKDCIKLKEKITSVIKVAFDDSLEINVKEPSGKLHCAFAWKELPGFEVDSEYEVLLNASPIIGGEANLKLDELFLKAANGPVGQLYAKAKKALAKWDIEIGFDFIVEGKVDVDAGLKKKAGQESKKSGGGATGEVEMKLKASGSFRKQFIVSVEAEAEAGMKSSVKGGFFIHGTDRRINVDVKVEFSGVVFYYDVKFSGGLKRTYKGKKKDNVSESEKSSAYSTDDSYVLGAPEEPWVDRTFTI